MNSLSVALLVTTFGLALMHACNKTVRATKVSRVFVLLLFCFVIIIALSENIAPALHLYQRVLEPLGVALFGLLGLVTLLEGYSSVRALWAIDRATTVARVSFVLSLCGAVAAAMMIRAQIS
jgi:hypothetical protein